MQYFLYTLAIPFLIINCQIIYIDIKKKIIPNKLLWYLLILLPFFYIYFFINFSEINYLLFIIKIIFSLIISFILYSFWVWSAWDAKYLLILSLFIPNIDITNLIWNLSLLTIIYLLLYFLYFFLWKVLFLKKFRKDLFFNIRLDLKEKWEIYRNNKSWEDKIIILKYIIFFLLIFVTIRLIRKYIIWWILSQSSLLESASNNYSIYLIILIISITFLIILIAQKLTFFYFKTAKKLFDKKIINLKYIKYLKFSWYVLVLTFLLSFIWYEYYKNSTLLIYNLYQILTIYLIIYLIFKVLYFSYKISFWLWESELIEISKLKKWDIIDKQYLIKIIWEQDSLWAWKENEKWLFYPNPKEYIKNMDNPIDKDGEKILKKAYKIVNQNLIKNWAKDFKINSVKILNTFSFAPYIFFWFIITYLFEDEIIKNILLFTIETIKGTH